MLFTLFSATLLLPWACAQVIMPDLSNVTTAFLSSHIVPDVLQSFSPIDSANVTFTDSVVMQSVDVVPGILLTTEQTAMQPDVFLISSNSSGNISVVVALVDPDAPTPQNPNSSEFLHFLGGGFSADPTSGLLSNSSPALIEFFSPAPPSGSDPHRYVFLIFNQSESFDINGPMLVNDTTPRTNFSISDFAQAVGLGDPIAGNYFLVGPANSSTTATTQIASTTDASTSDLPTSFSTAPLSISSIATSPSAGNTAPSIVTSPTSDGISDKISNFIREIFVITMITVFTIL